MMAPASTTDGPRRTWGVTQVIVLVAVALSGGLLITAYLSTLSAASERERGGACMALQPQLLSGQAHDFRLPDLAGKQETLSAHRGKVVLLNFWATWCPPCVEELPSLRRLQAALDPDDFAMVTVSVDDSAEVVKRFIARHRQLIGGLPVLMDPSKRIPSSYGTEKFPETYLVDRAGKLRYRFINKRQWSSPAAVACIRSLM